MTTTYFSSTTLLARASAMQKNTQATLKRTLQSPMICSPASTAFFQSIQSSRPCQRTSRLNLTVEKWPLNSPTSGTRWRTIIKIFMKHESYNSLLPTFTFVHSQQAYKINIKLSANNFQAQTKGTLKSNLKGVAMGDSWISPMDSVNTWAPYLLATVNDQSSGYYVHIFLDLYQSSSVYCATGSLVSLFMPSVSLLYERNSISIIDE